MKRKLEKDDYKGRAQKIDEDIYCYVGDEILQKTQKELEDYLEKYFD